MLRRVLLLALLCASMWTIASRAAACPPDDPTATGGAMSSPDAPGDTGTPDHGWDAPRRNTVSNTQSVWNWPPHHSALAGISCRDGLVTIAHPLAAPRPTHARRHLHSIPLLI